MGCQWQNHNVRVSDLVVITKPVKRGCTTSLEDTDILVRCTNREIIENWISVFFGAMGITQRGSLLGVSTRSLQQIDGF